MRRVTVRFPLPLPAPVSLGVTVRMASPFGAVVGRVVGVYRAPADEWRPPGVLVEVQPV